MIIKIIIDLRNSFCRKAARSIHSLGFFMTTTTQEGKMKRLAMTGILVMVLMWGISPGVGAEDPDRQKVVIELDEYAYHPSKIILKAGVETELVLINKGQYLHEFEASYLNGVETQVEMMGGMVATLGMAEVEIHPKTLVTLLFTPEKTGTFEFSCFAKDPEDHHEKGMKGTLIVE
jgi:uncharacterized cupredoxin-like copper-binding protein